MTMTRDRSEFPPRPSVFATPFSYAEGKNGFLKTVDFEFTAEEAAAIRAVHDLCDQRVSLVLPSEVGSSAEDYAKIQDLDAKVRELALQCPAKLQTLLSEATSAVLVGDERQVQAVWQSYFLSNPIQSVN